MSEQERDTHFAGVAEVLRKKLHFCAFTLYHAGKSKIEVEQAQRTLISQFAYDLIIHAVTEAPGSDLEIYHLCGGDEEFPWEKFFESIPDLTKWPVEPDVKG